MTAPQKTIIEAQEACQKGKHILLVDDDPSFLAFTVHILNLAGYLVDLAKDGHEALRQIEAAETRGNQFDLLITDITMPGMSGVALLKHMRARGIFIPVLVVTGYLDPDCFKELNQMKCREILIKPFPRKELIQQVEFLTSVQPFSQA